ncbi:peptide ABC transporter permease [Petrotoga sp. 9PW.55.5.1]|uniref:ABC transporter permease n=1 Tax=Petrotoga sp. 9PW.55.5.1 TaxID=1308979 RepID=UPI000DC5AA6F|nr:ABC transporter permease [Petrotoga sp. 9PW.55.5.1]RAO99605.1 peptide ABC transporter permease [Petrotoga sp. 9PW.55.5.1]
MNNAKNSKLDKKMDKIKEKEEKGLLKEKKVNRTLRKFLNNKLAVIGLFILLTITFASIFAPIICHHKPGKIDLRNALQPPSWNHIFGTDKLGRDVFARVLYGGRISILVGFGSGIGSALIGVSIGSYAGYKGGWLDKIFLRISEVLIAFPQIVLVLLLVTILGQSLWNLLFIFILTGWAPMYRMARARMLSIREEEYVQALKAFGISDFVICYKHMLPNAIGPIAINITLSTAMFILEETSLSFLGLGVPLDLPTWGNILYAAQNLSILRNNWWIWLPPGIMISLFVLSLNFVGDGLRDAFDSTYQG